MSVIRHRLTNGLTLLVEPMHEAPVVALQAWVDVGSADEPETQAGIAHVHEHMLFKGTSRRAVGEIAKTVEASGGEINAWTSHDQTVYHLVLAASEMQLGLDILADALQHSAFDAAELTREIEVIVEEIRRAQDTPTRRLSNALFRSAYRSHPYQRPVIGSTETVRAMTREQILAFYAAYYRPERTTLVVCGDVDEDAVHAAVEKLFGKWPTRGTLPERARTVEPPSTERRIEILVEPVKEARLSLAWHIPSLGHEDIVALDAVAVILGHGDSSRLYAETRRRQRLVSDVHAYAYTPRDPGLFIIGATLRAHDVEAALASLLHEAYRLRRSSVTQEELAKAKISILSESAHVRETVQGQARRRGFFEVVGGDFDFETHYFAALERLAAEDLRRVAERYLDAAPTLVVQLPEERRDLAAAALGAIIDEHAHATVTTTRAPARRDEHDVRRMDLPGGAVLLLKPEDRPVVAMRAVALGGLLWESREKQGLGSLFGSMWGLATLDRPTQALAQHIARLGGSLAGFAGRNTLGLRAEFIAERWQDGLGIFCDALLEPLFGEADLERERQVALERIRNREDNPAGVAFDAFVEALYPTHPYGYRLVGTEDSVRALTLGDLERSHREYASRDKLVISVVGGFDSDEVAGVLEQRLTAVATPALAAPPARDTPLGAPRKVRLTLDKQQSHVIVGSMGVTVDDPTRHALDVLTTVLSGQGGRLFLDLRDRQSLAYSVSASALEGIAPGHVLVYIATAPEKVTSALDGLRTHLERLCTELVGTDELTRAQRYLVGTHAIDLQRTGARAMAMALDERLGLGYASHRQYAEQIWAVTAEQLRDAARRHLAPERLLEVIVGP